MNVSVMFFVLFAQSADSQATADLFDKLDTDGDGSVTVGEISDSQRPWFGRALRVSDQNEDGALSREELTRAVADPQPVVVATQGRGRDFDLSRLDRNQDGKISKDEVPQPLRQRFQAAFDRYGKDSIPVRDLQRLSRGQTVTPPAAGRAEMKNTDEMSADADDDGKLTRGEAPQRMRENIKRMDSNGDGSVSKEEFLQALRRQEQRNR